MLQNAVTAFTVSELLRQKQQGIGRGRRGGGGVKLTSPPKLELNLLL